MSWDKKITHLLPSFLRQTRVLRTRYGVFSIFPRFPRSDCFHIQIYSGRLRELISGGLINLIPLLAGQFNTSGPAEVAEASRIGGSYHNLHLSRMAENPSSCHGSLRNTLFIPNSLENII